MSIYDEIEIEDMTYHEATTLYTYPCPCGDQFEISLCDLRDGEDVAVCPSCSLTIKVIFEAVRIDQKYAVNENSTLIPDSRKIYLKTMTRLSQRHQRLWKLPPEDCTCQRRYKGFAIPAALSESEVQSRVKRVLRVRQTALCSRRWSIPGPSHVMRGNGGTLRGMINHEGEETRMAYWYRTSDIERIQDLDGDAGPRACEC